MIEILLFYLALSFRAFQCAYERRGSAPSRLGAALCTILHHGSCALLPPLLSCNAVQQHADRYCFAANNKKTFGFLEKDKVEIKFH